MLAIPSCVVVVNTRVESCSQVGLITSYHTSKGVMVRFFKIIYAPTCLRYFEKLFYKHSRL